MGDPGGVDSGEGDPTGESPSDDPSGLTVGGTDGCLCERGPGVGNLEGVLDLLVFGVLVLSAGGGVGIIHTGGRLRGGRLGRGRLGSGV